MLTAVDDCRSGVAGPYPSPPSPSPATSILPLTSDDKTAAATLSPSPSSSPSSTHPPQYPHQLLQQALVAAGQPASILTNHRPAFLPPGSAPDINCNGLAWRDDPRTILALSQHHHQLQQQAFHPHPPTLAMMPPPFFPLTPSAAAAAAAAAAFFRHPVAAGGMFSHLHQVVVVIVFLSVLKMSNYFIKFTLYMNELRPDGCLLTCKDKVRAKFWLACLRPNTQVVSSIK